MGGNDNLASRVREELRLEPGLEDSRIEVAEEEDGLIALDGYVDEYSAIEIASHVVFRVSGVRTLINRLNVHPPADE